MVLVDQSHFIQNNGVPVRVAALVGRHVIPSCPLPQSQLGHKVDFSGPATHVVDSSKSSRSEQFLQTVHGGTDGRDMLCIRSLTGWIGKSLNHPEAEIRFGDGRAETAICAGNQFVPDQNAVPVSSVD